MPTADLLILVPHPAVPAPPGIRVEAGARLEADALRLTFRLAGDLAAVRVPPPASPAPADGLWRHTCFEAFAGRDDVDAYHELNLAPSGAWAAYAFRAYRERAPGDAVLRPPDVTVSRDADAIVLEATVVLAPLVRDRSLAPSRLGLTAVVEDAAGALSYWALHHRSEPPDFHRADARTLRLEALGGPCKCGPS
ncbi:MAG TPA: DOMON-like domain-containing protein [Candidatus Binatia bacterium]